MTVPLVRCRRCPCSRGVDLVWEPNKEYAFLRISYQGRAERGEARLGKEVGYGE